MAISEETKQILGQVLDLTNKGHTPKQVAAEIGKTSTFVNGLLRRLPKLIGEMERETA